MLGYTEKFAGGCFGPVDNSRRAVYGYDARVELFRSEGMVSTENNTLTRTRLGPLLTLALIRPRRVPGAPGRAELHQELADPLVEVARRDQLRLPLHAPAEGAEQR